MIKRSASAVWKGSLQEGQGAITTQSATLDNLPYSFKTRFGDAKGTNPEELIAASHAGCFSMALSLFLGKAGFTADEINTSATLVMEDVNGAKTVTKIELVLNAKVPNITLEQLQEAANLAKENCPISRLLKPAADITLAINLV